MAKWDLRHLAALLFAAASCEPTAEHIAPEAGSQLKPLYVTVGEERAFQGWFDTRMDDRCDFYTGGNEQCIPTEVQVYFPDNACASVPIAIGCADQKVGLSRNQGFDGFFRLSPTTAATELHYKRADTCERLLGMSPPLSSNLRPFAVGAAIPAVELPEKRSEDKVRLSEELDLIVRVMSDGSRQPWTMFDRVRNQVCQPFWTSAGYRCIPHRAFTAVDGGEGSFLDESCTVPALEFVWEGTNLVASDEAGTSNASAVASPFAERPTSVYRVERLADGPYSIFTRRKGACGPQYANQLLIHAPFALGKIVEKIDASQFPQLARPHGDVVSGSTFVVGNKIVSFTNSGGPLLRRGVGACYMHRMSDGRRACLGAYLGSSLSYLDSECTRAVTFGRTMEPFTDRVLVKSDGAVWCRTTTAKLFGVSHQVTAAEQAFFYRDPLSGGCLAYSPTNAPTEYWQIEAEQPLRADDLVVDEDRHDP